MPHCIINANPEVFPNLSQSKELTFSHTTKHKRSEFRLRLNRVMKLSPQLPVEDFVQALIGGCHAGKLERINWACRKFLCTCRTYFISEHSTLLLRSRALRPLGFDRKQATCVAPLKFYVEPIQWKHLMGSPNTQLDSNPGFYL